MSTFTDLLYRVKIRRNLEHLTVATQWAHKRDDLVPSRNDSSHKTSPTYGGTFGPSDARKTQPKLNKCCKGAFTDLKPLKFPLRRLMGCSSVRDGQEQMSRLPNSCRPPKSSSFSREKAKRKQRLAGMDDTSDRNSLV